MSAYAGSRKPELLTEVEINYLILEAQKEIKYVSKEVSMWRKVTTVFR